MEKKKKNSHCLQMTNMENPMENPKVYMENPKDSTRKLLELINEYSKVAGYKINTQKSLAFLYTNNEKVEKEIEIGFKLVCTSLETLGLSLPPSQA